MENALHILCHEVGSTNDIHATYPKGCGTSNFNVLDGAVGESHPRQFACA